MRIPFIPALLVLILCGCRGPRPQDGRPVVLTDSNEVERHVGQLVTVQGLVLNPGLPSILGVEIAATSPTPLGTYAQATGVLYQWEITPEAFAASQVMGDLMLQRGPGTHYRIVDPRALASALPLRLAPTGPLGEDPSAEEVELQPVIEIDD